MKKKIKPDHKLFNTKVRFILDKKMDATPSKLALRKLAEVNELIAKKGYKSVEEMLQRANDSSPE